ncbi:MAG: peptidoglycan-binding protein [Clostridia bacterium]|nr:peptidoglycan-binding protein [Clostridia bacterium]
MAEKPEGGSAVRLAILIIAGLACAMVFSRGYIPRPQPQDAVGKPSLVIPAAGPASSGEAAHMIAPGGGNSAREDSLEGPRPASCSCDVLYKLWLAEPPMTGEHVGDLQEGLAVAGYLDSPADGVFGPATSAAVLSFQTGLGIGSDGVVDMSTWMALGRVCEPVIAASLKPCQDVVGSASQTDSAWQAILIDTSNLTLTFLENGRPVKQYPVGLGKPSTPTPLGQFRVIEKAAWAGGFGTRWMGLNVPWGKYGIHGTNKPWTVGQRKSGGCIRMLNRHVEQLYSMVKTGTQVIITAGPFGILGDSRPRIEPGAKGSYVYEVQIRLRRMGYSHAGVDGVYGPGTEQAVMQLQRDRGLPATGVVNMRTYEALGLAVVD